jgi:hypothetical protein
MAAQILAGTPGTAADAGWIDIVLADDEWVRREFDELIAYGWGGSGAAHPPTRQGAHEPRRSTPRPRPTHRCPAAAPAPTLGSRRTPARAPPG